MDARPTTPPRPPGTPDDVIVTWEARTPVPPEGADLGIAVPGPPERPPPLHRLVVLGDSLSHGLTHGAVAGTALSWPSILAGAAGIEGFRAPTHDEPDALPGLPLNLAVLLDAVADVVPSSVWQPVRHARLLGRVRARMGASEDHWERGPGTTPPPPDAPRNHALACWGWDLRDALSRTPAWCRARIAAAGTANDLVRQVPSAAGERSALRVLAGAADNETALDVATRLGAEVGADGATGIDTLVVALGANNVLGTVFSFRVVWTDDTEQHRDLEAKHRFNVWRPTHFAEELDVLVAAVRRIGARRVVWCTVPHVTVAPMLRGIGTKRDDSRWFDRYGRPWFDDADHARGGHLTMTAEQLRVLDSCVDQYCDAIVSRVADGRRRGDDWLVLDLAGLLDRLAYRRYVTDGDARPDWWTPYLLPPALAALEPPPDTRYLLAGPAGRTQGGLVSVDGVHPTTVGYGILAHEVLGVLQRAGADLPAGPGAAVDFAALAAADRFVTAPPATLTDAVATVGRVAGLADGALRLFGRPPL